MKHFTDEIELGVVYTGCHQDIPRPGCALTCLPALQRSDSALHSPTADPHWGSVALHSLAQFPKVIL